MAQEGASPAAKRQKLLHAGRRPPNANPAQQQDDLDEEVELPSDVEAAIQFLRLEVLAATGRQASSQGWPPLVLTSQIRTIIKDQRSIDAEVEALRQRNLVRLLKLPTGADEHGLMLTSDYISAVSHAVDVQVRTRRRAAALLDGDATAPAAAALPSSEPEQVIADAFCLRVLPGHTEVSISRARLLSLMISQPVNTAHGIQPTHPTGPGPGRDAPKASPSGAGAGLSSIPADQQLGILLQLGVISRHPGVEDAYLMWCPDLGPVIKSVMAGRKELLGVITRKGQAEVPERSIIGNTLQPAASTGCKSKVVSDSEGGFFRPLALDGPDGPQATPVGTSQGPPPVTSPIQGGAAARGGTRLRQSSLGVMFHLRDLLGRGDVLRITSTAGTLLRVVKAGG